MFVFSFLVPDAVIELERVEVLKQGETADMPAQANHRSGSCRELRQYSVCTGVEQDNDRPTCQSIPILERVSELEICS